MLTLDATLATAMSYQTRRPLVEIISIETNASIPFDGTRLDSLTVDETSPSAILHSSGRICTIHSVGERYSESYRLRYRYSDVLRQEFTIVDITMPRYVKECHMLELEDGNIGILYKGDAAAGTGEGIYYYILTVAGSAVATGLINAFTDTSDNFTGPFPLRKADNTYLMVFVKKHVTESDFTVMKMTSTDFVTWTGPTAINLTGFTSTYRKANPFLIHLMDSGDPGTIWLMLDYTESYDSYDSELSNVYRAVSADGGATWATPVKMTSYAYYKQTGKRPCAVQKTNTSMHFIYDEHMYCLHMDKDTTNFADPSFSNSNLVSFDQVNRKLYVSNVLNGKSGSPSACVVDVDNWEVLKLYNESSSPAIPAGVITVLTYTRKQRGDGQYLPLLGNNGTYQALVVIAGENDTVQTIHPSPADPLFNVTGLETSGWGGSVSQTTVISSCWVDADAGRLYCLFSVGGTASWTVQHQFGYFSLVPAAAYAWTEIACVIYAGEYLTGDYRLLDGMIKVYPESDILILNFSNTQGAGAVMVYSLSSGGLICRFHSDTQTNFPSRGLEDCVYINGVIYGIAEDDLGGYEYFLNFYRIDVGSQLVQYEDMESTAGISFTPEPHGVSKIDNDRVMVICEAVITIYTISTATWEVFTSNTVPGLNDAGSRFSYGEYDLVGDMIYMSCGESAGNEGITAFSAYGAMKQAQYSIGQLTTGWTFGTVDNLVDGYRDYETSPIAELTDQVIYAFWTKIVGSLYEGIWDKEGVSLNLDDYLIKDSDLTYRRMIDGSPAELSFSVSYGHLFDVFNLNSMLNPYLAKSRRLTLRFGEKIGGISYWQNFGYFTVAAQKISYQRGQYPKMQITAYDKSKDWEEQDIVATELYTSLSPEAIIADLLVDQCEDILLADIILGTWDTTVAITKQWIETDLKTIMQELTDRFGYYLRIDTADDVRAKKISDSNAVNLILPDLTKIINFTPDDDFAGVVNRVVVVGTELTDTEVLYAEERVAGLQGTVAYNTGKEDHIIWYSEDQSRKCRYPRLEVIKTTQSIGFMLSGEIEEYITAGDTEYYCVVTVDSPDLTTLLLISLACLVVSYFMPDLVEAAGIGVSAGITVRIGSYLTALFTWTTLQILGATGNYDYDIFACPVGYVRRTVQGEANDTTHQATTGKIVTKKIDDPYCYTQLQCQQVAEMELRIARMQRSRCKFDILANLKIEEGDTIQFLHPYSQQTLKVFITDLERVMNVGNGDDGSFIDRIEGWVL